MPHLQVIRVRRRLPEWRPTLDGMTKTAAVRRDLPPHSEFRPLAEPSRAPGRFHRVSAYAPAGDQPAAIDELERRITAGERDVVLLGATGTGKSATTAWLIERVQRPALVMAPNKTLAAQLAHELRDYFPDNAVEYFVSYYDYYQPEAYVPQTDTYIEKDSSINDDVERLRHSATSSLSASTFSATRWRRSITCTRSPERWSGRCPSYGSSRLPTMWPGRSGWNAPSRASAPNWRSSWPSWRSRASCWKPSGCGCAPS